MDNVEISLLGNGCGHLKTVPRFYTFPSHHKPRPSVLQNAIDILKDAYFLPKKFAGFVGLRQKRTERRESIVSVAQTLLHYTDLKTLEVSIPTDNDSLEPNILKIAQYAQVNYERAKRALRDLVKMGYLSITRQYGTTSKGHEYRLPSKRRFSISFFTDLGINYRKITEARDWKIKRECKDIPVEHSLARKLSGAFKSVLEGTQTNKQTQRFKQDQNDRKIISGDQQKNIMDRAMSMFRSDPSRSISDYYRELSTQ